MLPYYRDRQYFPIQILNSCSIVFSTLGSSCSGTMLQMNEVDNLIVDEAGQSIEAETLLAFQHSPSKVRYHYIVCHCISSSTAHVYVYFPGDVGR
jgi:hypothetical protein